MIHLLFAMILLPFVKKTFTALWQHFIFLQYLSAQKDTYYRALKHQRIQWRELIYRLSLKSIKSVDHVPLRERLLIVDDTINPKRGEKIELVSK